MNKRCNIQNFRKLYGFTTNKMKKTVREKVYSQLFRLKEGSLIFKHKKIEESVTING